jgi:hypothetical protein
MLGAGRLALYAAQAGDASFASVVSLNHWNGTAGTFSSAGDQISARTWNRFGTTTVYSTTQVKYGTTSLFIPSGSTAAHGAYLSTSSDLVLGTGDFTIECWAYWVTSPYHPSLGAVLWDWRTAAFQDSTAWSDGFQAGTGSTFKYYPWLNGGSPTPTIEMSIGQWYHVAATRASGVVKTWINGVNDITWTVTRNLSLASPVPKIGTRYSGGGGGVSSLYVDDVRITKGVARYTATFTPATAAFPDS